MTNSEQAAETAHLRRQLDAAREREAEARRAVGLLNAIIDALPVGVTVRTEDGTVMLENGMAADLTERATADISPVTAPLAAGEVKKGSQTADGIVTEERDVTGLDPANQRTFLIAH